MDEKPYKAPQENAPAADDDDDDLPPDWWFKFHRRMLLLCIALFLVYGILATLFSW